MSKSTKYFDLFSALKAGASKGVSPDSLMKSLSFTQGALAVYIHALRNKFGAEIESVRNGRTVVAYKLTNIAEMEKYISASRKPRTKTATTIKKVAINKPPSILRSVSTKKSVKVSSDGSITVPDADMDIHEVSDRELADLAHSLGL